MAARITGQVRIGIIGAGLIGQTHSMMLRQIADLTEQSVRVVAVADPAIGEAEKLASKWQDAKAIRTAREVLDDSSIDAVWICTPTAVHRDICFEAAKAGKNIFCEKPLAMSASDAIKMRDAIQTADVLSQVGLVLRFSPVYTVMKAMMGEPDAGRVLSATMRDDQDFPIRGVHASGWRNDPSLTAGGTLIEHSVHDFDLFTWMFGPVKRLYCRTRNLSGAPGVEDFGATDFEFQSGLYGHVVSIWHKMIGRPSNRRMEVFCENMFLGCDFDSSGSIVIQRGANASEETISESEVKRRFDAIIRSERPYLAPFLDARAVPYALEDASFIAALRGEAEPYPEFDAGVRVQRLVEAAYASARERRPIEITN